MLSFSIGSPQATYSVSGFFSYPEEITLILTSTQKDDSDLPSYIVFNGTDYIITPNTIAIVDVLFIWQDDQPNTVTQTFTVTIYNNIPTILSQVQNDTVYENVTFSKTVNLSTIFNDADSAVQTISYYISSVPSLLSSSIVGSILTLNGVPSMSNIGSNLMYPWVTDTFANRWVTYNLTVKINNPPIASTIPDIYCLEMQQKNSNIPAFIDPENDPIYYSMLFVNGSALNSSWITFNNVTLLISITAPPTINSLEQVVISGTDNMNPATTATINIHTDFKPKINSTVTVLSGKFIWKQTSTFVVSKNLFYDEDTTLTYSLTYSNGSAIDSWMAMILPSVSVTGNFEFTGNYQYFNTQDLYFTLTAKDSKGQTNSVTITVSVMGRF